MPFLSIRRVKVALKPVEKEDEDVDKERQRIERGEGINDILRLDNLTKVRTWLNLTTLRKPITFVKNLVIFVTTRTLALAFFSFLSLS